MENMDFSEPVIHDLYYSLSMEELLQVLENEEEYV